MGIKNSIKKARASITGEEPELTATEEILSMCPKLTYEQRFWGFCGTYFCGAFLTLLSFGNFMKMLRGDPVPFVFMYSVGNILALASTMFLCGPKNQLKKMSSENRRVISLVYVSSILFTIIICFISFPDNGLRALQGFLIILGLCVEMAALVWYSLSYIPYGRATATSCLKSSCCCCFEEV